MSAMEYGSEFDWESNRPYLSGGAIPAGWQLFRSGRDALRAAARLAGRRRVLLPALCCASMILPFEQNGYEVAFYRLKTDLSGDAEDVLQKLRDGDVLLTMRYFGIRPFSDTFLHTLRDSGRGIFFLEDRTHDILIRDRDEGFAYDAQAASLRKWAALPEGGMLETALGSPETIEDPLYGELRSAAMREKSRYLKNGDEHTEYLEKLRQAERLLDHDSAPVRMRPRMRAVLEQLDFSAILAARRRNLLCLRERLHPLTEEGTIRLMTEAPEKSGLYLPILIQDRDEVQRELLRRRIYCPAAIWPEPPQAHDVCPVSHAVTEHMLSVLCDQRYSEADMDYIAENLIEIIRKH